MKPLPLDELYLKWLYEQIAGTEVPRTRRTFWNLAKCLYTKEFFWYIPNDDNRAEDGRALRYEFIEGLGYDPRDADPDWMMLGCSMLELLIGLSRRLAFQGEGEPRDWFWHLINNLGIRYNDLRRFPQDVVEEVLDNVIDRTYDFNGRGGLFPLEHPPGDQRLFELWHQLNSYLLERN